MFFVVFVGESKRVPLLFCHLALSSPTSKIAFFLNSRMCHIWKFPGQEMNLSCICDLHHSSTGHSCILGNTGSFNPPHQARDRTHASAVTQAAAVRFLTHCNTTGTPVPSSLKIILVYLFFEKPSCYSTLIFISKVIMTSNFSSPFWLSYFIEKPS